MGQARVIPEPSRLQLEDPGSHTSLAYNSKSKQKANKTLISPNFFPLIHYFLHTA